MTKLVRVINPNSNRAVTSAMAQALEPLQRTCDTRFECINLDGGPAGIESEADVATVTPLLRDWVVRDNEASAFVIGCYSDPGIHVCREATDRPVFGIQECAALLAVSRRAPFGVISILPGSVERHWRRLRELGLDAHCAGDRALGMSVAETEAGGERTFERLVETGSLLRDEDGARSLILGCTGMASHRSALQEVLDMPVIEPTQAATSVAAGAVALGW